MLFQTMGIKIQRDLKKHSIVDLKTKSEHDIKKIFQL